MKKYPALALFLREARVRSDLSQKEVSDVLGYRTAQFVSNWERGLTTPPGRTLRRLCDIYSISAEALYEVLLEHVLQKTETELETEFFGRRRRCK